MALLKTFKEHSGESLDNKMIQLKDNLRKFSNEKTRARKKIIERFE
jgi:hypothetical protein